MKFRILIIDDEPSIHRSLRRVLDDNGYAVEVAATAADGVRAMEVQRPHIVLLDLKLPDGHGLDVMQKLRLIDRAAQVIVVTAFGDTTSAVRAMKQGAVDFLRKPYDLDELTLAVDTAARSFSREAELSGYRRRDRDRYRREELIYRSEVMEGIWSLVRKAAASDSSILITGESGTGKELVARALHFEGPRRHAPFMELNCSAFQETLIENELFGHERGAFTGASQLKRGLVELSDGGTLFLDEIGDMPMSTQAKLLRFLEDRAFRRVGGSVDITVDIRVLAATNVDLDRRIQEGRFRMDLFYRLQVVSIQLPPLRERGDDVNLLADHYLRKYASEFHKGFHAVSTTVRDLFRRYQWPGNVRELRNLIERIVLIEDGEELGVEHLPRELLPRLGTILSRPEPKVADAVDQIPSLREVEEEHIRRVLDLCAGNKSQAARVLGLSRQGLLDRIKRLAPAVVTQ